MTKILDLPQDLAQEILSRVPITSNREVRLTCKQWNLLFKDESFTKKHQGKATKEMLMTMLCESRVCLMSVNLYNRKDGSLDLSLKKIGQLNHVDINKVFHCNGLFLCTASFVPAVWNPYLGQVRRIKLRDIFDRFAIGYDKNNNFKILRCLDHDHSMTQHQILKYEIYDFKSDSRRVFDVAFDWHIPYYRHGLSLNGNTYFVAQERIDMIRGQEEKEEFLLGFDFTREQFGPRMPLLFHSLSYDSVMLSPVGQERLAVLFHRTRTNEIEIRITTKVDPSAVSWSNFLKFDMRQFTQRFNFVFLSGSFFIDEEKKVAVICPEKMKDRISSTAYIIGKDGYYKEADLENYTCWPFLCSYVPSSVQIPQGLELQRNLPEAKTKIEIISCLQSFWF